MKKNQKKNMKKKTMMKNMGKIMRKNGHNSVATELRMKSLNLLLY